jgi:hypothetical protein
VTTNGWLAVIGVVSVLQLAIVIAVLVGAMRFYQKTAAVLDEVRSDVRDAVDRVRRADDAVRNVMHKAGTAAGTVALLTKRRAWPLIGIVQAVRAGAGSLFGSRNSRKAPKDRGDRPVM